MNQSYPAGPLYDRDISELKFFKKGVVVFDRDSTLIEDAGQHNKSETIKFLPGALEAVKFLASCGYGIAIASNQSGLESGKFGISQLMNFNNMLKKMIKDQTQVELDLIVVCPHLESSGCLCRKPKVGLLESIVNSGLGDIKVFIGDSKSDKLAAQNFGVEFLHADGTDLSIHVKNWFGVKCA
jgi:D-glycero-D-manno-heptose 1,7-bisphosphate phosphatase